MSLSLCASLYFFGICCQDLKRFCFVREEYRRPTPPNLHEHISAFCVFLSAVGGKIFCEVYKYHLWEINVNISDKVESPRAYISAFGGQRNIFCRGKRFFVSWEKIIRGRPTLPNLGEHIWQKLNLREHIFALWAKNIYVPWPKYFCCWKQIFALLRKFLFVGG